jgi:integrase
MAWGEGRIFKRGSVYWLAYYCDGKEVRESSKTDNLKAARDILHERVASTRKGELAPREAALTFNDLEADILHDYELNNRPRSLVRLSQALNHLRGFFRGYRIARITTASVREYILQRKNEEASNGTINVEIAALKRMLRLAHDANRIGRVPFIPLLVCRNARQGFFDHSTFLAVKSHLPEDVSRMVSFLYLSGWRIGEAMNLQWRDVDWNGRVIVLRREHSKNAQSRTLALRGELLELVGALRKLRRLDCLYVFHHNGQQMRHTYTYGHWKQACREAGQSGRIIHDLRRTAIRNMVRAGVPTNVVMSQTGHLTDSVFRRYDIVSEIDLAQAQERLDAYLTAQTATPQEQAK